MHWFKYKCSGANFPVLDNLSPELPGTKTSPLDGTHWYIPYLLVSQWCSTWSVLVWFCGGGFFVCLWGLFFPKKFGLCTLLKILMPLLSTSKYLLSTLLSSFYDLGLGLLKACTWYFYLRLDIVCLSSHCNVIQCLHIQIDGSYPAA